MLVQITKKEAEDLLTLIDRKIGEIEKEKRENTHPENEGNFVQELEIWRAHRAKIRRAGSGYGWDTEMDHQLANQE